MADSTSVYAIVGGDAFFADLVERFYDGVAADDTLSHMYPEDLTAAKAHLRGFLIQYWGGPTTYSDERGHPRLRMRHAPFVIGQVERDAWLAHMLAALGPAEIPTDVREAMVDYFTMASTAMINHAE